MEGIAFPVSFHYPSLPQNRQAVVVVGCVYFFIGGFFARLTYKHHVDRGLSKAYAFFCGAGAAFLWPISLVMGIRLALGARPYDAGNVYAENESEVV